MSLSRHLRLPARVAIRPRPPPASLAATSLSICSAPVSLLRLHFCGALTPVCLARCRWYCWLPLPRPCCPRCPAQAENLRQERPRSSKLRRLQAQGHRALQLQHRKVSACFSSAAVWMRGWQGSWRRATVSVRGHCDLVLGRIADQTLRVGEGDI